MLPFSQGNLDAVELLISHGADVLAKNVAHTGALNMATNYANHKNDDRVKKVIATAGLSQSLRREDLDAVSDMIEVGGADVNYQDTHANSGRWTALILATAKRNLEAVAWLIGIGADPNIPEKDGWTPLFFAVFSNDAELCRLILEAGSDYHYRLSNGKSALDLARSRNAPDVIQVLEEHEERERLALEQGNNEDPARETLPNVVETGPSEEETTRERARLEQHQREQHQRDELRRRRQAELQRKEDYAEEDVRYEDVEAAEPESLVDKLMSFLGL